MFCGKDIITNINNSISQLRYLLRLFYHHHMSDKMKKKLFWNMIFIFNVPSFILAVQMEPYEDTLCLHNNNKHNLMNLLIHAIFFKMQTVFFVKWPSFFYPTAPVIKILVFVQVEL